MAGLATINTQDFTLAAGGNLVTFEDIYHVSLNSRDDSDFFVAETEAEYLAGRYVTIAFSQDHWQSFLMDAAQDLTVWLAPGTAGAGQVIHSVELVATTTNVDLLRQDVIYAFCAEFLDANTEDVLLRLSDVGYEDEDYNFWHVAIDNISGLSYSINVDHLSPQGNEVTIDFTDTGGKLAALAESSRALFGTIVNLYIRYYDGAGGEVVIPLYSGRAEIVSETQEQATVKLRPALNEYIIGQLQNTIDAGLYTSPRQGDIGKGEHIIAGEISTNNGAVELPVIDDTDVDLFVSRGYIKSVDQVYKHVADVVTSVSFSTNYVTNDGGKYTEVLIDPGDYDENARYFANVHGITDGDLSTGIMLTNQAEQVQTILTRYGQITDADIDDTFALWKNAAALDGTAGNTAIVIPRKPGELITNVYEILELCGKSFDVGFYVTADGKIAVAYDLDLSKTVDNPDLFSVLAERDISDEDVSSERSPIQSYNKAEILIGVDQSTDTGYQDSLTGIDDSSATFFGQEIDAEIIYPYITDSTAVQILTDKRILRASSGTAKRIIIPFVDLSAAQLRPGERIFITHPNPQLNLEPYNRRQLLVESVDVKHEQMICEVTGLLTEETLGPVRYSGQNTILLEPILDTWINDGAADTAYGGQAILQSGKNIQPGADEWRLFGRWALLDELAGSETILSVNIEWETLTANNDRISIIDGEIFRVDESTWGLDSTWNKFSDNGTGAAWPSDDSLYVEKFADVGNFHKIGWNSQALNVAAINFLNAKLLTDGLIDISFLLDRFGPARSDDDTNEFITINGMLSLGSWRFRITYRF